MPLANDHMWMLGFGLPVGGELIVLLALGLLIFWNRGSGGSRFPPESAAVPVGPDWLESLRRLLRRK